MATKGNREQQPDGKQWQPPRGIRYSHRADRPKPFLLHWRGSDGIRQAQAYPDAGSREIVARSLAEKRLRHGSSVLSIDPIRWARYLEFQTLIGEGTDPLEVGRDWAKRFGAKPSGLTVEAAAASYLKTRREEQPNLAGETWRHIQKHVQRFAAYFGPRRLNTIDAEGIREWLKSLVTKQAAPMQPLTLRHHRRDVNAFLKRAVREQWIERNPCELVAPPHSDPKDQRVATAEEAFRFFKVNRDEPCIGRIALEALGGVRYTTAGLIGLDAINFDDKGINMGWARHKSRKRKFRQGHPAALWEWLKHAPAECWTMDLRQYREAKKNAMIRAGFRFHGHSGRNVWRNSFASYMIAATKNIPLVSYLMQHTKISTTQIYEGLVNEADAKAYLAITPASVLGEYASHKTT